MTGFLVDCKHALRLYSRTPVASFIAIAILAIAMGFVTLFLSLYATLVLRPHPGFEQSRELVTFGPGDASNIVPQSKEVIDRIASEVVSLESAAGIARTQVQIDGESDRRTVELVTPEFFPGLKPKLELGRGFVAADYAAEAERVVVISHAFWQERFEGRADVLETTLALVTPSSGTAVMRAGPSGPTGVQAATEDTEDMEVRIVGVMSPDYTGFAPGQFVGGVVMWLPDEHGLALLSSSPRVDVRVLPRFNGLGRRNAGASSAAVAKELTARYGETSERFETSGAGFHAVDGVVPSLTLQRELRRALQMIVAASLLLALVAAANVTLFLLARAPGRRRELAIRLSVGAPLKRLGRQLVTEAAVFVAVAGLIAVALATWLSGLLRTPLQSLADTSLDWRVLALLAGCLALLTLLVSLSPVLGLRQLGIGGGSRQVTARATLAQQIAGTVQIAVAGALSAAGLAFAWQVGVLLYGNPGHAIDDLHYARFSQLSFTQGPDGRVRVSTPTALATGFIDTERRHEAIASVPGVEAVSITTIVPGGQTSFSGISVESAVDPTQHVQVRVASIDSRFTTLLGLRVVDGRTPGAGEPGVALVNRTLAQAVFGRDDVAGESLALPSTGQPTTEIVGVVEDLSFEHPAAEVPAIAFVTSMNERTVMFGALIKSGLPSAQLERQLRDLAASGAIELPPSNVRPLATLRANALAVDLVRAALTMAGALLVVVLAVTGFYGTQRYLVTAGRREYAIRASLGAGPAALGRLVIGRGLRLGLPGIAVGTLIAFATVAWLRDNYIPREMSALAIALVVAAALVLMLLAASFAPARRARRTQPAPLLRDD